MGNKQSKFYKAPSFQRESWHLVQNPKRSYHPQHGLYYLYRNNLTNEQVQQYQIFFHNQAEYQKYLQFFQWRQREDSVVNTKFINSEQTRQFCNSNHNSRIYIEHIPVRLSDIQDIPYPQNLYVLFSALDGFEKLFHFVGYFRVAEDLVCIDCDGRVKVWLNSDLSKCHTAGSQFSDEAADFQDSQQHQQQMVAEIVELIEKNTTDEIEAGMTFTQHLWHSNKQRRVNFKQARQEVIAYAKKNGTEIPNYFESVMGIFMEERPSDLEEPSVRHDISERARYQQNRIISENRQSNQKHVEERGVSRQPRQQPIQQQYLQQQTDHSFNQVPRESAVYNSVHQPAARRQSFDRVNTEGDYRPGSHPVPTFSTQVGELRPQSPVGQLVRSMAMQPSNPNFQVKFNYQPTNYPGNAFLYSSDFRRDNRVVEAAPRMQPLVPLPTVAPVVQANPQRVSLSREMQEGQGLGRSEVKGMVVNNKVVYSDTTETYELDEEIVKDIIKYFG